MDCSICLDEIKSSDNIFTLSCNHKLHYSCFLAYALKKQGNIFVNCPICRVMNISDTKSSTDPELNIRILCSHEKSKRCCHKTKKGLRCTNNRWYTKIFLIDLVKKLLIKYPEIDKLEQIHYYMLRFKFHRFEDDYLISPPSMYEYYNLKTPPDQWANKCINNCILI